MPRATPQRVRVVENQPNSMIASAATVTRDLLRPSTTGARAWQNEAWNFYDSVGELRAAATWLGNALSRVRLTARRRTPDGSEEATGLPAEAVAGLFDGETGQSQALNTLAVNLTVPGEAYVVAEPSRSGPDNWMVLATDEIKSTTTSNWTINRGDISRELPANALIMRVWRPHPRRWIEADSSVRAVLPILREVVQLTKHVAATADSRLAGAGLLIIPSEMTFATPTPGTDPNTAASDPFLTALIETMVTPINDRASAAAVVPMVLRAPGAVIDKVQHVTFSTPFDDQSIALREEAIKRLALGTDLPPEIMLGTGDANHWSAWQIDESALKIYVEPLVELICDAFTRKWMWPVLEANGEPDYDVYIDGDTSDLRVRPNHATEAIEVYDRGQLSPEALRRETGFTETDTPTDEERREIILLKLAQSNNDLTGSAVDALGIPLTPADIGNNNARVSNGPQIEAPPGRDRTLPQQQTQAANAVLAAAELLVLRALERANNRINRRGHQRRSCDEAECTVALAGAWTNVPRVAASCGLNPGELTDQLDAYVRRLLVSGEEHDPERLAQIIFPRLALVDGGIP